MSIAEKLTQIAENEQKVYEAGYEKGKAEGGDTTEAYEQGVADGKKAEYDAFWDSYQDKGEYKMSHYMFAGNGWNDKTFKPKYDIKFRYGCTYTFGLSLMTDIVASLQAQGVTLNTKEASNLAYLCYSMASRSFPVLDTTGVTGYTYGSMRGIFYDARKLEYIDKIITNEAIFYNDWFYRCEKLKDVTFEGVIGNNIDFQYSTLLSKASIKNIIGCLSDTASGKTLTLSKAAVENAFSESEKTTIPFGFDTSYEGTNVTAVDNGDGTVTVNGFVNDDTEFEYREAEVTFTAGSYIISVPEIDCGYVDFECYDLDGNKLTAEYSGDYTWALNTDKSFVVKACVYLQYGEYTDYVIPYPAIQLANSFDALIATKPNWTINLV